MKTYKIVLALTIPLLMFVGSCNQPSSSETSDSADTLAGFELCVDFSLFPDNTTLPQTFTLGGLTFSSPGNLFVNETGGDRGLQFDNVGLTVEFPVPVSSVRFILGTFNTDVKVEAFDPSNNLVASDVVAASNSYNPVQMTGADIIRLVFTGGGSEGILKEICIDVDC